MFGVDYLPAYELCRSPRIIVAFDLDFLRNLHGFRRSLKQSEDNKLTILLQLGWSVFEPKYLSELSEKMNEARRIFPDARIVLLANDEASMTLLKAVGECLLCSQNAFLDPRRYPLFNAKRRKFDAIYIARITPFKRHSLAANVQSLHLVGSHSRREEEYYRTVIAALSHARYDDNIKSYLIPWHISLASCGLALSALEGAMFACGEYSLCGRPVVNTANKGGRDILLPEFSVYHANDTPESVAEGVEYWKENAPPPREIRDAFLKLAKVHRDRLEDFVASIAGKRIPLPHKLGVRCHLLPHQKLLHGIRAKNKK